MPDINNGVEKNISRLVATIEELLDSNDGHGLSTQAGKLAIQLEHLLEGKADAKRRKNVSYASEYEKARLTMSQGDAKIHADAKKSTHYEKIEALESGIKSILSTVKDKLHWLELESLNKNF